MESDARISVRERVEGDFDDIEQIAVAVQELDGYPGRRPRDMRKFLTADDALGAWVAERDGRIVGHVALHEKSLPVVMEKAAAVLQRSPEDLAVVARLIVDPGARRLGVGRALIEAAASAARGHGRYPILDVVTEYAAANALYLACGWTNAGAVDMVFGDGTRLRSYVYVAPAG